MEPLPDHSKLTPAERAKVIQDTLSEMRSGVFTGDRIHSGLLSWLIDLIRLEETELSELKLRCRIALMRQRGEEVSLRKVLLMCGEQGKLSDACAQWVTNQVSNAPYGNKARSGERIEIARIDDL